MSDNDTGDCDDPWETLHRIVKRDFAVALLHLEWLIPDCWPEGTVFTEYSL